MKKKSLIIVESPTKAKTIHKFLGNDFSILSSYGHIRDLPKSKLGINLENNFEPQFVIPTKSRKNLNLLKKEVEKTKNVILATDEDREGEAIAYHLKEALKLKDNYQRIVFHEITKEAIKGALANSRKINMDLVHSQFGRRILDRIVGYNLSPFLWKKVVRGLSAGRVQSVAVRLIAEREREIQSFTPQEYWSITALLKKGKEFKALLDKKDGKNIPKIEIKNKKQAEGIVQELKDSQFQIEKIQRKEIKKYPLPPFKTSTLQRTSFQFFKYSTKKTMFLAQSLYEQGHITYHRTDSLNLSSLALNQAEEYIGREFGKNYHNLRRYKTKEKSAQEAHEAIRPTYVTNNPKSLEKKLKKEELRIYELIFKRFTASQMKEAIFDSTSVDIKAKNYTFTATGQILKFDGFLKIYPMKFEEKELPELKEKELVELIKLLPEQHFTKPPARYNEASLVKILEENGIGRPSTYAPIISTIQLRNYVRKNEQKRFQPTEIGITVNDILVEHFPEVVDIKFTSQMEGNLDEIAQGKKEWNKIIEEFYYSFSENLKKKEREVEKKNLSEKTDKLCPKCNSQIIIKFGRFGKFYACTNFPECKYTESLNDNKLGITCPKCKKGEIIEKKTKRGKLFYGCERYPKCDFAVWDKPIEEKCPKCNWPLTLTKRREKKCSNPECD